MSYFFYYNFLLNFRIFFFLLNFLVLYWFYFFEGQTLDKCGLYLPQPVFGHGQLYVALSRVRNSESITIYKKKDDDLWNLEDKCFVRNKVYNEVLPSI